MRKLIVLVAVLATAAALAVPALGATKRVSVGDNYFETGGRKNGSLSVRKGDKVRFRWVGDNPHTVTKRSGPGGAFNSGTKTSGSYTKTFTRTGTYQIICRIHPPNQKLTIRVR